MAIHQLIICRRFTSHRLVGLFLLAALSIFQCELFAYQQAVPPTASFQEVLKKSQDSDKKLSELLSESGAFATNSREDVEAIADRFEAVQVEGLINNEKVMSDYLSLISVVFSLIQSETTKDLEKDLQRRIETRLANIFRGTLLLSKESYSSVDDAAMSTLSLLFDLNAYDTVSLILDAMRSAVVSDSRNWGVVLSKFYETHPRYNELLELCRKDLPKGKVAVEIAEAANQRLLEGNDFVHPFDCDAGIERLREWLDEKLSKEMKEYGAPTVAAITLAFLKNDQWRRLLKVASENRDWEVRAEAGWVGSRRGDQESIKLLVEMAGDIRYSSKAARYLEEVGLQDQIPKEVKEPEFAARAELAAWLAHPNELGSPPDEVIVIDKRKIKWPLEEEEVGVFVLRYAQKDSEGKEPDKVGVGMVGPMTFCHFDLKMEERPLQDVYGIHVYRELEAYGMIEEVNVNEVPGSLDYLLRSWKGDILSEAKIVGACRLSSAIEYPRKLIAFALAKKMGEEGWVVLDGPRSTWYPKSKQPKEVNENAVLMLHVGRQILGM